MNEPIAQVDNLEKTFKTHFWSTPVEAVRNVSFEVERGEIFGIVGPNGAGKTTTMKMMTNLVFPDHGAVELFGGPVADPEHRTELGYLPEEPYFYDHLSASELVRFYGSLHGMSRSEIDERIDELLELVGLGDVPDRPLREFSKGMRQRAGIAQALVGDPELVILDEPQSGLDPVGRRDVRDLITRLHDDGKTVIFSSHILVDVEAVCDRVAILADGELVEIADLEDLDRRGEAAVEITASELSSDALADAPDPLELLEERGGSTVLELADGRRLNEALTHLIDRGATIRSVERRGRHLEQAFLEDTKES